MSLCANRPGRHEKASNNSAEVSHPVSFLSTCLRSVNMHQSQWEHVDEAGSLTGSLGDKGVKKFEGASAASMTYSTMLWKGRDPCPFPFKVGTKIGPFQGWVPLGIQPVKASFLAVAGHVQLH